MKRSFFFSIGAACILLSHYVSPSATKRSCSLSTTALSAAMQRLIDNDNAKDLEGLLAGYTDDAVLLPPRAQNIAGKVAIRSHYERLFSGSTIALSIRVLEARAEGDLGVVRGATTGTVIPQPGATPNVVNDKFLGIVRCEAGHWRVSHLMWSPEN